MFFEICSRVLEKKKVERSKYNRKKATKEMKFVQKFVSTLTYEMFLFYEYKIDIIIAQRNLEVNVKC